MKNPHTKSWDDRSRGILSEADRQYLRGEKEYASEQSERDARYRIRNRVKNSILDFTLLLSHLDQRDREQVFSSQVQEEIFKGPDISGEELQDVHERIAFLRGIEDLIGFVYVGLHDANQDIDPVLEAGLEKGYEKRGKDVDDVTVDIDIQYTDAALTELAERFIQGEELTESELKRLLESDEIELNAESLEKIFAALQTDLSEHDYQSD